MRLWASFVLEVVVPSAAWMTIAAVLAVSVSARVQGLELIEEIGRAVEKNTEEKSMNRVDGDA